MIWFLSLLSSSTDKQWENWLSIHAIIPTTVQLMHLNSSFPSFLTLWVLGFSLGVIPLFLRKHQRACRGGSFWGTLKTSYGSKCWPFSLLPWMPPTSRAFTAMSISNQSFYLSSYWWLLLTLRLNLPLPLNSVNSILSVVLVAIVIIH